MKDNRVTATDHPAAGQADVSPVAPAPSAPGVLADDPMAEAGRKILRFQFRRVLAHEAGSRSGEDIEDVHDMRVATRRMRAAFRLVGPHFQKKVVRPYRTGLGDAGRALGGVRDLDVFELKARRYLKKLPSSERRGLDPLLEHWRRQREEARQALVAHLDSKAYHRFVDEFGQFLATEGAGANLAPPGQPVRHQVRHYLSSTVWQLYEQIWAYEPVLADAPSETLHALRIDCKRLRYTLEFFVEVLGPETRTLIRDIVAVQDHLGDLQDAEVASELLAHFLANRQAQAAAADPMRGVADYLAFRRQEARSLIASFPQMWPRVDNADFRKRLATALSTL